jgi:hypothetical protein
MELADCCNNYSCNSSRETDQKVGGGSEPRVERNGKRDATEGLMQNSIRLGEFMEIYFSGRGKKFGRTTVSASHVMSR